MGQHIDLNAAVIYPLQKQADQAGTEIPAPDVSRVISRFSLLLAEKEEEEALAIYLALRANGRRLLAGG